ncbi:hypothetical protein [Mammaliicoccus sciuri]|uniref:hypothetical protein n=1 Tax=Mammaliicoccus sciuri TaxID=1296 RepID=UPI001E301D73|nr:hypothetical protein [Mammaliicoccus sciuri]MCD8770803.1 hypothetical protein [Mammaliicoccus sciuri]
MKYLITLTILLIALYTFIKRLHKYAAIPDEVEPPIDYESDKYKEAETWFSGVGRH